MIRALMVTAAFGLAACASASEPPASAAPAPEADQCRAADYTSLIGKPKSAIPAKPEGANWRIVCSSCAVTLDYRPDRLNIVYDTETEIVREVKCG